MVAKEFEGRTENQIKNRFYSTLRRIATKKNRENPAAESSDRPKSKKELLKYVGDALDYGHSCCSKRGRKKKKKLPLPSLKEEVKKNEEQKSENPQNNNIQYFPVVPAQQIYVPYMIPVMQPRPVMQIPMDGFRREIIRQNQMLLSQLTSSPILTGTMPASQEVLQQRLQELLTIQQNLLGLLAKTNEQIGNGGTGGQ